MGSEDSVASTLLPVHREKRERTRRRGRAREATGWHIGSQKEHGKTARSKRSWRHRGLSNRRKTYRTRIRDKEQNATTADAAERKRESVRERQSERERQRKREQMRDGTEREREEEKFEKKFLEER